MAASTEIGLSAQIAAFEAKGTPDQIAANWRKYIRRFELYLFTLTDKKVSSQLSKLLYVGGDDVIAAYDLTDLPTPIQIAEKETEAANPVAGRNPPPVTTWTQVVEALTKHVEPTKSKRAARRTFRETRPLRGETMDEFTSRLKSLSVGCEFTDIEEEILQQIVCTTDSRHLLTEIYRKDDISLAEVLKLARVDQATKAKMDETLDCQVAKVHSAKPTKKGQIRRPNDRTCINCGGSYPHKGGRSSCPAYGETCNKCMKQGHFASVCRSSQTSGSKHKERTKYSEPKPRKAHM